MPFQTIRVKEKTASKTARNLAPAVAPPSHQHLVSRCLIDTIMYHNQLKSLNRFLPRLPWRRCETEFQHLRHARKYSIPGGTKKRRITLGLSAKKRDLRFNLARYVNLDLDRSAMGQIPSMAANQIVIDCLVIVVLLKTSRVNLPRCGGGSGGSRGCSQAPRPAEPRAKRVLRPSSLIGHYE
jgi:hypothetical protein